MSVKSMFVAALAVGVFAAGPARAASYFLFDGDSQRAVEISSGAVVNSFSTFSLGYPVAITSTIWLGGRDNGGATEFTLAGTPTGNSSAGGTFISQLLDGTTDGTSNYGVTCCQGQNVVTVANADWSNQQILFNIAVNANGIAFNTVTNTLYVSDFAGVVTNYSLAGAVLGSFNAGVVGLAYDQGSNSLFGWNTNSSSLDQYSLTGTLLGSQVVNVAAFGVTNPYGGEIGISAVTGGVPEPASWAMLIAGFGLTGAAMRRRRQVTLPA